MGPGWVPELDMGPAGFIMHLTRTYSSATKCKLLG